MILILSNKKTILRFKLHLAFWRTKIKRGELWKKRELALD